MSFAFSTVFVNKSGFRRTYMMQLNMPIFAYMRLPSLVADGIDAFAGLIYIYEDRRAGSSFDFEQSDLC